MMMMMMMMMNCLAAVIALFFIARTVTHYHGDAEIASGWNSYATRPASLAWSCCTVVDTCVCVCHLSYVSWMISIFQQLTFLNCY